MVKKYANPETVLGFYLTLLKSNSISNKVLRPYVSVVAPLSLSHVLCIHYRFVRFSYNIVHWAV